MIPETARESCECAKGPPCSPRRTELRAGQQLFLCWIPEVLSVFRNPCQINNYLAWTHLREFFERFASVKRIIGEFQVARPSIGDSESQPGCQRIGNEFEGAELVVRPKQVAVDLNSVPLLCRVSRSVQLQTQEFVHGVRSHFHAGWLPASH